MRFTRWRYSCAIPKPLQRFCFRLQVCAKVFVSNRYRAMTQVISNSCYRITNLQKSSWVTVSSGVRANMSSAKCGYFLGSEFYVFLQHVVYAIAGKRLTAAIVKERILGRTGLSLDQVSQ